MVEIREDQDKIDLNWEFYGSGLKSLYNTIKKSEIKFNGVYGLSRGGLPIAVYMSHNLNIPYLSKPQDGCLIVDDIADSGKTLTDMLYYNKLKDYKIATIYYKKESKIKPDYYVSTIKEKDWIVFPYEVE